jgi:hypothetical protein
VTKFPPRVRELLERCSEPDLTANERGKALEDLVADIFGAVPGIEVRARNAKSVFENEELDLVMTNRAPADGLPALGPYFSVECKNWSRPVGSAEVSWFATKLRRSSQSFGVLVAANGVTARAADMTAANFEAATALSEGQAVVVLTVREIGWLSSGAELANALSEKHARLVARRELYIADQPPGQTSFPPATKVLTTRAERDVRLQRVSEAVAQEPDLIRTLEVTVDLYWAALVVFEESENQEIEADDGGSGFDRWSEANMIAFEGLEIALDRLARACVARLRQARGATWSTELLALGLDTRTPSNLEAPPGSELSQLLIDHWMGVSASPHTYVRDPAVLCLLGWAIEWLIAMDSGRWPPSPV